MQIMPFTVFMVIAVTNSCNISRTNNKTNQCMYIDKLTVKTDLAAVKLHKQLLFFALVSRKLHRRSYRSSLKPKFSLQKLLLVSYTPKSKNISPIYFTKLYSKICQSVELDVFWSYKSCIIKCLNKNLKQIGTEFISPLLWNLKISNSLKIGSKFCWSTWNCCYLQCRKLPSTTIIVQLTALLKKH